MSNVVCLSKERRKENIIILIFASSVFTSVLLFFQEKLVGIELIAVTTVVLGMVSIFFICEFFDRRSQNTQSEKRQT